ECPCGVGTGPLRIEFLAQAVVFQNRFALFLPCEIEALCVFFKLDQVELKGVKFVGELDGNAGPAKLLNGCKAALTGDEFARVSTNDDGVDEARAFNGLSEVFDTLKRTALTGLAVDTD